MYFLVLDMFKSFCCLPSVILPKFSFSPLCSMKRVLQHSSPQTIMSILITWTSWAGPRFQLLKKNPKWYRCCGPWTPLWVAKDFSGRVLKFLNVSSILGSITCTLEGEVGWILKYFGSKFLKFLKMFLHCCLALLLSNSDVNLLSFL